MNTTTEIKDKTETFCAPCLAAIPLVFGTGGAAASSSVEEKGTRNIILWVSIGLIVLSVIAYVMLRKRNKKCKTCPYNRR